MSAPPQLHFGPAELARLAELKSTIPPAELDPVAAHWTGQSLSRYMQPLASPNKPEGILRRNRDDITRLRSQYQAAIGIRGEFCKLFTGPAPFFLPPIPEHQDYPDVLHLAQVAVDQSSAQIASWAPGHENWQSLYATLVQQNRATGTLAYFNGRPFIKLMSEPYCAALLDRYVEYVAVRMARSSRWNPASSSPVVWLGYTEWHSINFFDQARVVLAAKEYEEYVRQVFANRALGLSTPKPWHLTSVPMFELQHLPSLTSRQARRSGVSQEELEKRWT
ncbi:hypothetical protein BCR35DRAFT_331469 [Leucosporidium creatinivorum]|uniref:Uncharacterized protein n=1 Tax=Leucosporidium creatinivorum TaxID=106004 RepID=A0A1Y2FGJ3_9BASI|nr:hypothetical protein BCR35DRAFT_331469 [Leucosporidium creatinivorum]